MKTADNHHAHRTKTSNREACHKRQIDITIHDLPLSCPPREDRIWDAHPRVYLPIAIGEEVACPYCGTIYRLEGAKPMEQDSP